VLPPISWTDRHRTQASGLVWLAKLAGREYHGSAYSRSYQFAGGGCFQASPYRSLAPKQRICARVTLSLPDRRRANIRRQETRPASAPITVGDWQTVGVEPVARVTAAGRGGRSGQRGRYGIDGGYAGVAVFGLIEAGLAGAVIWAARRRRRAGQARDLGAAAGRPGPAGR
jgi:hypothetical protein